MSDLLRMEARIQMVRTRAEEIFRQLQNEKENGLITTEVEEKKRFFDLLYEFYIKLGKPTMEVREAWGPPFSEDYNQTMEEILKDFHTLFDEAEALKNGYKDAFEQADMNKNNLSKQIEIYEQKLSDYAQKLKQEYNQILFRESFDNNDKYQKDFVRTKPALISPEIGGLIISPIISEQLQDGVVRIKDGSNGLPGNTHQVRVINGEVRFYGDTDAHWNIAEIVDGNADTWFEFEKYYLEPEEKLKSQDFGFNYEEKVSWVFDDYNELALSYEVEFDYAQPVNWIGLTPFLPSEKGANPATLKSVVVHDGKGGRKQITQNEIFNEAKIWMFEAQQCKKIEALITQNNAYEVKVGHLFFKELETQAANFLNKGSEISGRRIAGPMPSIEELGIRWNKQQQKIMWGEYIEGFTFENEDERKSKLFSVPVTDDFVQADFEFLNAYRYMIGIREMNTYLYQFDTVSEYVSKPFYSPEPIWMVELEADHYVPENFGEGDWIEYYISANDGQDWEPILPKNVRSNVTEIPKTYWINTNTPKEMRVKKIGYLEIPEDSHEIRLKIITKRPNHLSGYTPIVKEVRIKASTVNEVRL